MIDSERETLVRLTRARIPGNPHTATVWRWALRGVRGVKLDTLVVGGVRFTSEEAIARFLAALNDQPKPPPPQHAAEDAGKRLAAMGA